MACEHDAIIAWLFDAFLYQCYLPTELEASIARLLKVFGSEVPKCDSSTTLGSQSVTAANAVEPNVSPKHARSIFYATNLYLRRLPDGSSYLRFLFLGQFLERHIITPVMPRNILLVLMLGGLAELDKLIFFR